MTTLKYTVIHTRAQYDAYCDQLVALLEGPTLPETQDEIDLLTLLIETWDREHNTFAEMDPVQLLRSLMEGAGVKAQELAQQLGVSKGLLSDILNYKKGFSKTMVRALAERFRVAQEAFNRPYALRGAESEPKQKVPLGQFASSARLYRFKQWDAPKEMHLTLFVELPAGKVRLNKPRGTQVWALSDDVISHR